MVLQDETLTCDTWNAKRCIRGFSSCSMAVRPVGHDMLRRRHANAYCAHDAVRIWGNRRPRRADCAVVPGFAPTRFTSHLAIGLAFWLRFLG
jgi:hypothetical protein